MKELIFRDKTLVVKILEMDNNGQSAAKALNELNLYRQVSMGEVQRLNGNGALFYSSLRYSLNPIKYLEREGKELGW